MASNRPPAGSLAFLVGQTPSSAPDAWSGSSNTDTGTVREERASATIANVIQYRRLCALLLGAWLGAGILADVAVTQNFQAVDRFLQAPGSVATSVALKAIGRRSRALHPPAQCGRGE